MCGFVGLTTLLAFWTAADAQVGPVPSFDTAVVFGAGSRPYGLAAADVVNSPPGNYPEVAVACGAVDPFEAVCASQWNGQMPSVRIYRNTGTWSSNPQSALVNLQTINVPDFAPAEVQLLDMNGDAIPDLIFSCASLNPCDDPVGAVVVVPFDETSGQFGQFRVDLAGVYTTVQPVRGLVVADLDGDGHNDVAAATDLRAEGAQIDRVYTWKNDGLGNLSSQPLIDLAQDDMFPAPVPADLALADFDRTGTSAGKPDLVVGNDGGGTFLLLRNAGGFGFTVVAPQDPGNCQVNAYANVAAGRFGGGSVLGAEDVVAVPYESADIAVFHGDGAGGFTHDCDCLNSACDVYDASGVAGEAASPVAGHINGGTRQDIVATLRDAAQVKLLLGRGDGTFETSRGSDDFLRGVGDVIQPVQCLLADMDQDGFNDILTANLGSNNISVLISRLVAVTP